MHTPEFPPPQMPNGGAIALVAPLTVLLPLREGTGALRSTVLSRFFSLACGSLRLCLLLLSSSRFRRMRTLDSSQDVETLKGFGAPLASTAVRAFLLADADFEALTCYGRRLFRLGFLRSRFC